MRTLAAIFLVLTACNKGGGGYDHADGVSPGTVVSAGQPESMTDPVTGKVVPVIAGQTLVLNPAASDDLRADAATTATQPTPDATLDPRTYSASGTYTAGAGVPSRALFGGQFTVPFDGETVTHPACASVLPAPGATATTALVIDGALSDWTAAAVVSHDRTGDLGTATDADLTDVYAARSATDLYLAVNVAGTWGTTYDYTRELVLELRGLTLPSNTSSDPYQNSSTRFYIRGSDLHNGSGILAKGTAAGQTDYALAISGGVIELRLPRSAFEPTVGSVYVMNVYARDLDHNKYDRTGHHVFGLTDDYACLLPMPSAAGAYDRTLMVVFRRASTVDASQAEVAYRAFLAAAQAADYTTQDHSLQWETVAVTVTPMYSSLWVDSNLGIFLRGATPDMLGHTGLPREHFRVGAMAYLLERAGLDYALPRYWTRDGYTRWMTNKTLASYYGKTAAQYEVGYDMRRFLSEDAQNPTVTTRSIDDDNWNASPFTSTYYTTKSEAYTALLSRLASYPSVRDDLLQEGRNGWPLWDTADVIDTLKDLKTYTGAETDDLTSGWMTGEYAASALPTSLLADADGDGLFAFQEADFGTSDTAVDTSRSGIADLMKYQLDLSPTAAQGLSSLVVDNYLADWELLKPGFLSTAAASANTDAQCGTHTTLTRYGAAFSEGWLVLPLELAATPTSAQGVYVYAAITEGSGTVRSVYQTWGSQYVQGTNTVTSAVRAPVPFSGRTLELAVNAAWLGWTDGKLPAGTTVTLYTMASGASTWCQVTAALTPAQTL